MPADRAIWQRASRLRLLGAGELTGRGAEVRMVASESHIGEIKYLAKRQTRPSTRRRRGRRGSRLGLWLLAGIVLVVIFFAFQLQRCSSPPGEESWLTGVFNTLVGAGRVRVGLVAGHAGSDSGATCPDGLQEATVNKDIAERTAGLLRRAGYRVDVLEEFDSRLKGYSAGAFVSIHTDSCVKGKSGFKVARLPASLVPQQADRLVQAIYEQYAAATGLSADPDTITNDMREYHAFREISPLTPAAIIEVGFLGEDRELLTQHADLAARGLAKGIITFLREQGTPAPAQP
jgi:N-acetylmuramoyl-L-alanine amidase